MPKPRVAFVNTHPIQYFAPMYRYFAASGEVDVSAVYLSDYSLRGSRDAGFGQDVRWDVDLLSGYRPIFVPGAGKRGEPHGFWSIVAPGIAEVMRREGFDAVVVHGHTPAALLLAARAARRAGSRVFFRGETHLGLARGGIKAALRRPVMGTLYRRADGVFAIGSANAEFYRSMGVPEGRIFRMPYTIDNARFAEASRLTPAERAAERQALGARGDDPIVLFAAKLQPRKRPLDLVRAAAKLEAEGLRFHLAFVGSGELEGEVRSLTAQLGLSSTGFTGFVNQSRLPAIYGASDVFVLPSENEPWGLAVNEAMAAGLPVVASREIGSVPDLVADGVNGATFPAGDVDALAGALRRTIGDAAVRRAMGEASRARIARWSYAEALAGLMDGLAATRGGRSP
jgi:glycosyltransferase involved in cell wall biosynthesis